MTSYSLFVILHVIAGTASLATFWTAAALRKGSPLHRRVGHVYLWSMLAVLVTGVPLVTTLLARGQPVSAAFLGFLLLLTGNGCWSAWRAIRDRRDARRYFGVGYWALVGSTALGGTAIVALGLHGQHALLIVFGSVGLFAGFASLHSRRRARIDPKWWLKEHYGAMVGNGVATHIAFLGIGLSRLLPDVDFAVLQQVAWFAPLIGAAIATVWLNRRYGGAPQPRREAATPVASPLPNLQS
jgi:hypothetical protein